MANLTKMGYVSAANNPFNRLKGHKLGAILKSMHPSKQFDLAYSSDPAAVRTALSLLLPRSLG